MQQRPVAGDRPSARVGAGQAALRGWDLTGGHHAAQCLSGSARRPGWSVLRQQPIDLAACSASIERPRNRIYQRWLLRRLVRQTLADPYGVSPLEQAQLQGAVAPRTIRAFDSAVTAPRWGFADVEAYYREASPLQHLVAAPDRLPRTLLLQALDDPWVPA